MGHDVVDGSLRYLSASHADRYRRFEACRLQDRPLVAGGPMPQYALAGSSLGSEVRLLETPDVIRRWQRMRKRLLGGRSLDLLPANVNEGATGLQHVEHLGGHQLAVHPVEGLGERRAPKGAQARRQFLRPQPQPPCIGQVPLGGQPGRLSDYPSIGVYTDDLGEQIG